MILSTRHVLRGWFRKRAILQVAVFTLGENTDWRDATETDLMILDRQEKEEWRLRQSDRVIPNGTRVKVRNNSGFHRGAQGETVFQEPAGGKVWVWRDGSGGPCYFFNEELEII